MSKSMVLSITELNELLIKAKNDNSLDKFIIFSTSADQSKNRFATFLQILFMIDDKPRSVDIKFKNETLAFDVRPLRKEAFDLWLKKNPWLAGKTISKPREEDSGGDVVLAISKYKTHPEVEIVDEIEKVHGPEPKKSELFEVLDIISNQFCNFVEQFKSKGKKSSDIFKQIEGKQSIDPIKGRNKKANPLVQLKIRCDKSEKEKSMSKLICELKNASKVDGVRPPLKTPTGELVDNSNIHEVLKSGVTLSGVVNISSWVISQAGISCTFRVNQLLVDTSTTSRGFRTVYMDKDDFFDSVGERNDLEDSKNKKKVSDDESDDKKTTKDDSDEKIPIIKSDITPTNKKKISESDEESEIKKKISDSDEKLEIKKKTSDSDEEHSDKKKKKKKKSKSKSKKKLSDSDEEDSDNKEKDKKTSDSDEEPKKKKKNKKKPTNDEDSS